MANADATHRQDAYSAWNEGLVDWLCQEIWAGRDPFYVNFMFRQLAPQFGGNIPQMHRAMERFYGRFCTRCVRNPRAPGSQDRLPRLLLFPDLPVFKRQKISLREATVNDGLHFNGFLMVPDDCRLQRSVEDEVASEECKYWRHGIARIHVERLAGRIDKATDYALKTVKRGPFEVDSILVLPRTLSQLSSGGSFVTGAKKDRLDFQSRYNLSDETTADMLSTPTADEIKVAGGLEGDPI